MQDFTHFTGNNMNYLASAKTALSLYTHEITRLNERLSDEFNQAKNT